MCLVELLKLKLLACVDRAFITFVCTVFDYSNIGWDINYYHGMGIDS